MNKMESVFQNQKALLAFLTAGDPSLDKTEDYILTMEQAGMDNRYTYSRFLIRLQKVL